MGWIFLIFSISIFIIILKWNLRRPNKWNFQLRPNCLITDYPFLFIDGKKSIFYFTNYWNYLPHFLSEHGYEVYEFPLPWRDSKKRIKKLKEFLQDCSNGKPEKKFHLIIEASSLQEIRELLRFENFSSVESCTLITEKSSFYPFTLKHPIEDVLISKTHISKSRNFSLEGLWYFHKFWTQSWSSSPQSLGLNCETSQITDALLEQAQLLAERDFNKKIVIEHKKQGRQQHDKSTKRTGSHFFSNESIPPSSC